MFSALCTTFRAALRSDEPRRAEALRTRMLIALVGAGAIVGALLAPNPNESGSGPTIASVAPDSTQPERNDE